MAKRTNKTRLNVVKESKVIFPDNLEILYTNSAFLSISDRDVTIDFGIRRPELSKNANELPPTQINKRIFMSIQHAKVFSEKLKGLIEHYEKDFGQLNTEPIKK